jgi:hypothetical protein
MNQGICLKGLKQITTSVLELQFIPINYFIIYMTKGQLQSENQLKK